MLSELDSLEDHSGTMLTGPHKTLASYLPAILPRICHISSQIGLGNCPPHRRTAQDPSAAKKSEPWSIKLPNRTGDDHPIYDELAVKRMP